MPSLDFHVSFSTEPLYETEADLLLLHCFAKDKSIEIKEKEKGARLIPFFPRSLDFLDLTLTEKIKKVWEEEDFQANAGSTISLAHLCPKYKRILLCGLGEAEKANRHTIQSALTKGLQTSLKLKEIKKILIPMYSKSTEYSKVDSLVLPTISAFFHFSYRSQESLKAPPKLGELIFFQEKETASFLSSAKLQKWKEIALAPGLAMDLVNSPPNLKSTASLAKKAKELEKNTKIKTQIQEDSSWIAKEMPCFFAVARGSLKSDPPRWIHLTYKPSKQPLLRFILIGKSVMFDTGGYQLKPDSYMNTMKADMTGGASVLAVFAALEKLQIQNIEIHGMLAATPNMVDSNAFVPDSILSSTCGKKVEIHHTDAEGRLTLIDAVAMAQKEKPDLILTIATLTGAASRALGPRIALMSNDSFWQIQYEEAAELAGEPLESLSVETEDFESIESKLDSADIINDSHNKYRGAQTAAAFILSGLSGKQALLHLDIAGGDVSPEGKATGIAVKSLLEFLLQEDARLSREKKQTKKDKDSHDE